MPREPPWSGTTTTRRHRIPRQRGDLRQYGLGETLGDEHDRVLPRSDEPVQPFERLGGRGGGEPDHTAGREPAGRRVVPDHRDPIRGHRRSSSASRPPAGHSSRQTSTRRRFARSASLRDIHQYAYSADGGRKRQSLMRAASFFRRAAAISDTFPPAATEARTSRITMLPMLPSRAVHSAGFVPARSAKRASSAWPAKANRDTVQGTPARTARESTSAADRSVDPRTCAPISTDVLRARESSASSLCPVERELERLGAAPCLVVRGERGAERIGERSGEALRSARLRPWRRGRRSAGCPPVPGAVRRARR